MKQRRVSNMGDIVRAYAIASALFMCAFSFTPFGKFCLISNFEMFKFCNLEMFKSSNLLLIVGN